MKKCCVEELIAGRCGVSPLEGVAENGVVELVETAPFGARGRRPFDRLRDHTLMLRDPHNYSFFTIP